MSAADTVERPAAVAPALFAATAFASAGLVFLVQPMMAKLVLPLMGGSPSVWNTSLAFFQAALLAGYAYAHLLQRLASVKRQVLVHGAVLVVAALVLPLQVSGVFGPPAPDRPALWLLGVLAASVGAPFAALSATAPLVQAWHARVIGAAGGREPYVLYAASNLGSLIALLAYPALMEPLLAVDAQRLSWSLGYGLFVLLIGALGYLVSRAPQASVAVIPAGAGEVSWRDRLTWLALAAAPSSLMLGVTTHLTMDVASAPFLWVAPLALYLLTFIIAFQSRPAISPRTALVFQAAAVAAALVFIPFKTVSFPVQLGVNLAAFFFTALICHQALVARRPDPVRLTEFYLWLSLGGVLGGAFNAFLAPVIFDNLWEYQIVLVLACLARPWGGAQVEPWRWAGFAAAVSAAAAAGILGAREGSDLSVRLLFGAAIVGAFVIRGRGLLFFAVIVVLALAAQAVGDRTDVRQSWRSFFGVLRISEGYVPELGGTVKMLAHGTTLHGAQATSNRYRCRPLVYYAPETPIGQVFNTVRGRTERMDVGAVGLGTGAVASYTRPGDTLTFFEIDPLVVRIATDPQHFTYTTECAGGRIGYLIGDARLTLQDLPKESFDILLIDAFSSDSIPTHLLTVEAVRSYLARLKPDGILVLHLSNRNLELRTPAMAVAHAAGGHALMQRHSTSASSPPMWESAEDVLIVARSEAALAPYAQDPRWRPSDPYHARPWTDDYTNVPGALYARLQELWMWLP